ncbi:hypothetical protein N9Y26_01015 [bacterium]|nr:hypothetical protein [bacterium]
MGPSPRKGMVTKHIQNANTMFSFFSIFKKSTQKEVVREVSAQLYGLMKAVSMMSMQIQIQDHLMQPFITMNSLLVKIRT